MFTPEGQLADKIDKIMLLALWVKALRKERAQIKDSLQKLQTIITVGMGQPTYPISVHTIDFFLAYWKHLEELVKGALNNLDEMKEAAAIDYGHPQGDEEARVLMADAMTAWYKKNIKPEHILFTTGGAGGLRVVFEALHERYKDIPLHRVITPFPHYGLYGDYQKHRLHPIDVMKEPGFRLTAEALEKSIIEAYELAKIDGGTPKAVLICNPSNPLGTVISEAEFQKIADVLRKYPDLHLIFDEAYTEMTYVDVPSFLQIAPDLQRRTVIMRSATKGLSMAGERMAMLLAFDPKLMNELLAININISGHAPRSLQMAYAHTMSNITENEKKDLKNFYKEKVDYVTNRLKKMGAEISDPDYNVEGTFYVLADFSDMFGLEIPEEAIRALGKRGQITTDEELTYYLLFQDSIMIAPLSYYGVSEKAGLMRITCSKNLKELEELMDRLESRLLEARQVRKTELLTSIDQQLQRINDPAIYAEINSKLNQVINKTGDCLNYKSQLQELNSIHNLVKTLLSESSESNIFPEEREKERLLSPRFFSNGEVSCIKKQVEKEWEEFLDKTFGKEGTVRKMMAGLSEDERLEIVPWREYLASRPALA
ncbi:pyridoxal phosphate-dependent aminotransferase [Legionella jamestowniensis]|uniref:Aminotransferase n=1 Tax=Legionella jamestowniensis TaxID=455 RepID=A0A0W0UZW6_9GAMM|nr:pyridoxal phosphate-dependent aminotransferase [Legionella jamestowniensis]KTD13394.1 aspartate aminotransferase A [Legionella jamestowniensis]SFL76058.1 aminotransferase [Legionella jamestowniensis DSM 19215]